VGVVGKKRGKLTPDFTPYYSQQQRLRCVLKR
jgi:hypothetical protein